MIEGTRISVAFILELLAANWTEAEIAENYPGVTPDAIRACLSYARDGVGEMSVVPSAAE